MDPNSRAATVLADGGPSALEVAYKRKGIEMDLAKNLAAQKAAKDATKVKEKVADDKAQQEWMKTLPSTSKLQHSIEYAKVYRESLGALGKIFRENGGKPREGTPGWEQMEKIKANLLQLSNNSTQMDDWGKAALAQIEANRASGNVIYTSDAEPKVRAQASNYENITNGILGTMPKNIVDTEAMVRKAFDGYEYDVSAWENPTKTGEGIRGGTREFVPPGDLKQAAEAIGSNAVFAEEVKDRLSNPGLVPPERAKFITDEAKRLKITPAAMYALDYATGLYDHVKSTASYNDRSESGSGRKDLQEGVNWLSELTKSVLEGTFKGDEGKGGPLFGVGMGALDGENLRVFDGWKVDEGKVVVPARGLTPAKEVESRTLIDNVTYDRAKGEWLVHTTRTGDGKKEERNYSNEKWESEIYPTLIGQNKDKLEGIGKYVNTRQVSPNFEGKDAQNMTGANIGKNTAGVFNPLTGKVE